MKHFQFRLPRLFLLTAAVACVLSVGALAASSGVITEDVVNARKGPGTSYDRVEMLAKGKQVSVIGEENGWYKIQWNDSTGYVLKSYVAVSGGSSTQSSAANATVTGGSTINVRSGPGTEYSRIDMVAEGKRVAVLEQSGDWCKVSFNGQTGYILAEYLRKDGSSASSQTQSVASNATVVGGSSINVRSGPGTGADRVMVVAEGKRVAVLEQSGSWYKVSVDGKTGYIYSDFLRRDGAASDTGAAKTGNAAVKDNNVNVRSAASTNSSRITTLSSGKRITLTAKEGGWYKVSFDGKTGYIYSDYVTPDSGVLSSLPVVESAPAAVETPAAEEAPAMQNPVAQPPADEPAEIPASTVEASSVEGGSLTGSNDSSSSGVIYGGTINVRTGPGTEYDRITKVTTGKKVNILGEEGDWLRISFGDTTGYVLNEYVYEGDSLPESLSGGVGAQVASMAAQYLGTRYVYGGAAPGGFDCSGFTLYLYKQFGYSLPHSASGQYANCGYRVSRSELQPGDLVFFASPSSGGSINHVGVYVGGGDVIHARYSVGQVYRNNLSESYYSKYYVGAIRIAG